MLPKDVNMIGISSSGKNRIHQIVEDMFDNIALQLIGNIPRIKNKKRLIISSNVNFGLSHLFVQAMQNKPLNMIEQDVMKSLLESAHGYIEALKNKTRSNVAEMIDGLAREAKLKGKKVDMKDVQSVLDEEMKKAKSHLKTITESESTKFRNLGTAMDIIRVASSLNDPDPTVLFLVTKDEKTCSECIRLHLMPDKITPKTWKLSELKSGYGKRGDSVPSLFNRHPNCRCGITYLSLNYGFNSAGKIVYKYENYDAYKEQRNNN